MFKKLIGFKFFKFNLDLLNLDLHLILGVQRVHHVHLYSPLLLPLQPYTCTGSRYVHCILYSLCTFIFSAAPSSTIYLYWIQVCILYTVQFFYMYILLYSSPFNNILVLDLDMYSEYCTVYVYILLYSSSFNHILVLNPGMYTLHYTVYVNVYSPLLLPLQPYICTESRYVHCILYSLCTFIFSAAPPSTIYLYWIQVCILYSVH